MKTKLITLLMLSIFCLLSAHAELKHFLPTNNAYMSILDYKFWFEGDTIIENKEYLKVYKQFCPSETECNENKDYYAAVRQDTINEKIYCIQVDDGIERLIADFDVEAGDEVTVYSFWLNDDVSTEKLLIVVNIDYILIDNEYRKRVTFREKYSYFDTINSWVEGIGSLESGLFFTFRESIPDFIAAPSLLCLHIDDRLIYQRPNNDTCYEKSTVGTNNCVYDCIDLGGDGSDCEFYCAPMFDDKFIAFRNCVIDCTNEGGEFGDCLNNCYEEYKSTSISKNSYKTFNISLSPTNDCLFVETGLFSCSYMIYNTLGSVVKQGNILSSEINISTLSQGVYFVVFYHEKELIYIHKFVK